MTGVALLLYLGLVAASFLAMFLGPVILRIDDISEKQFLGWLVLSFFVTTIVSTFMLYGLFGYLGTGDLINVFYPQATSVLQGFVPYRDFPTSYSPGFVYLIALPLLVWNDPLSINMMFVGFDFLALVVGYKYAKRKLSTPDSRLYVWFYVFLPLSWLFIVFWNQDEAIACFFLILSATFVLSRRENLASFTLGLGFFFTKFLFAVWMAPMLALFHKQVRGILVTACTILTGYVPFLLAGVDVLMPVRIEVGSTAIGANLWVIFEAFEINTGLVPSLMTIVVLGALWVLYLLPLSMQKRAGSVFIRISSALHHITNEGWLVVFGLLFLVLSKKSLTFYALSFAPFLLLSQIQLMRGASTRRSRLALQLQFYIMLTLLSVLYYAELALFAAAPMSVTWVAVICIVLITVCVQLSFVYSIIKLLSTGESAPMVAQEDAGI